jgi:DivIVA domain-containing protein
MPTADEVRAARFRQSPMAWRGFSEQEVTDYLGRVADGLAELTAERDALAAETRRLRADLARLRQDYRDGGPRDRPVDPGDLLGQLRTGLPGHATRAEQYADAVLAESPGRAAALLDDLRRQAARSAAEAAGRHRAATGGRPGEVDRVVGWLGGYLDGLHAALQASVDTVHAELTGAHGR